MNEEQIREWIEQHNMQNMDYALVAKAIVIEMIQKSSIDEKAYPGLKQRLIDEVNKE